MPKENFEPIRRSILASKMVAGSYGRVGLHGHSVRFCERHPITIVQIETQSNHLGDVLAEAERVLGKRPTVSFQSDTGSDYPRIIRTGPNRMIVVEPEDRNLEAILHDNLLTKGASVLDLSHGRVSIRVSGEHSRRVFMKGSAIDWHKSSFRSGMCAQTAMFSINTTIDCLDVDTFDLYFPRSLAECFWHRISDAAAEFGYLVTVINLDHQFSSACGSEV